MSLHALPPVQVAAEYGATSGALADRISTLAGTAADSAREAWQVALDRPVLLAGLFAVGILASLIMRNPAR